MKNNKWFILIILAIFLSSCSSEDNSFDPVDDEVAIPPIEERLQSIIDNNIGGDDQLIGVSVSIRVGSQERWSLVGGNSKANEPIASNMRFGVGSVTKTAVAATILKLEDEGVLSTDDTIGDWITLNDPNVDDSITILQLLNHFTGVKDYFAHPEIWNTVEGNLDVAIPPVEVAGYIEEPINDPGLEHQYSNSNYLLLGLIIEAATQKTVGEVMREKFWAPLNLNGIYFSSNEPVNGPIASPWRDNDGNGTLEDIADQFGPAYHSVFYCAAGIFSTASDLSMWAQHLYDGDAISQAAKDKMLTSYVTIPDPVFTGYGLGVRRNVYANKVMWGHTGGMRGYGTHMFFDPVSKVSIAVLNNQSRSINGPLLRHELVDALLTEVYRELDQ